MTKLRFIENIQFISIALRHHNLGHLLEGIELEGCWNEAGNIVTQLKDSVPVEILHEIYDSVVDIYNVYAALLYIDSTYQPWIDIIATNTYLSYRALRNIDSSVPEWIERVTKSPKCYQKWLETVG